MCIHAWWEDFPGGTVGKDLPADAEDVGLTPGLGRSHRLPSNQSRSTTCTERLCSAPEARVLRAGTPGEKPPHHRKEQPPLAAPRESLPAAMKTQRNQK